MMRHLVFESCISILIGSRLWNSLEDPPPPRLRLLSYITHFLIKLVWHHLFVEVLCLPFVAQSILAAPETRLRYADPIHD